ncbi:MAG: hypothetical protein CMF75_08450 [Maricaulis sp.]|nr:hypothetical protein [Maricaulis sp.]
MQATNSSPRPLDGRTVLVTGAGKGLGAAFARALAQAGANVVVNNRIREGATDEASAVAEAICRAGGRAVAEHSDVTDADAPRRMLARAMSEFGGLDAVVCNAGTSGPAARFDTGAIDVIRSVMETNFFANVALLEALKPALETSTAGRALLVSSSAGLYGVRGRAAYAASKGALNAFALTLADEWRDRIGVNILCPYAATRMTGAEDTTAQAAGPMAPDNIAQAAVWLASPACTRTGETWLGGGKWLRRVRTVETEGGLMPDDLGAMDAFADSQAGLDTARGFTGAEAAFADLFKTLSAAMREPETSA